MASTQYLNVLRVFRGTTLRVRDDVIEMKSGSRFTLHATTPIALPYFELHPAWYEPIVFRRSWDNSCMVLIVGASDSELELENLTAS
jgi:hypothetical protein